MKFDKFVEAGMGKSAQPVEPSQSQMSKLLYSVIARNLPIKFYNPQARKGYLDSLSGPRRSSIVTQKTGKDALSIGMANKNAVDELAAATSSGDNSSTVRVKCSAFFGIIRHMPANSHSDGIYGLIRNCVVADRPGGLVMSGSVSLNTSYPLPCYNCQFYGLIASSCNSSPKCAICGGELLHSEMSPCILAVK